MTDAPRPHRFGPFVLDVANRRLFRDGEELAVRARAFDVLVTLVDRPEQLVTKDQLLDAVWTDLAVEENNLQVQVSSLRRLLGPGWIVTVPGRGYRFSGRVETFAPSPPSRAGGTAGRIPEPVNDLVGREADLAAVSEAVRTQRLVTLLGPGGVGKTRLAQSVGKAVHADFADGVTWIDLAEIPDPLLVVEGTATALGLASSAEGMRREDLVGWLAERDLLLLFDNAEHVVEALAPLLAGILAGAPRVRVLVTSTRALQVRGEHVHRLEALELPGEGAGAASAAACSSVSLFVSRARALVGDFRLDTHNVTAVVELCRRLDGLPLALELAAGRLPSLGLEGLTRRLEQRFRVLGMDSPAVPYRQRNLQALFDWSYDLLGADEQAVFRRLGALGSTFSLEDAVAVASEGTLDEWAVVEILGDLVDRSLVFTLAGDPPEYTLRETGRAYARSRLDPAVDAVHLERALRRFESAAIRDAEASRNAGALRSCSAALELLPLLQPGGARDALELEACLSLGPVIQTTVGPAHPRAEAVYRRASELAETLPPGESGFMALWGWWHFLSMSGRDREAAPLSERLVELAAGLGDEGLQLEAFHAAMTTHQLLGVAGLVVENAARVTALYDPARHAALGLRFGGHDAGICALGQGAVGLWLTGRADEAIATANRALALGETMNHAYSRGVGHFYASFLWCVLGERDRLRTSTEALLALCEAHAMTMLSNEALLLGGRARWEAGDEDRGIADMERALDTIDAGGDFAFALLYTALLAEALLAARRTDDAARRLGRAGDYARDGQGFFLPEVLRLRGELAAVRGDLAAAARTFEEARERADRQGAPALALRAATSAARHAGADGRGRALEALRAALAAVEGGGLTRDGAEAKRLLSGKGAGGRKR